MIQSSHPSILNRFRSLLAEREEEYGISDYNDVPQLSTEEIVQLYEVVLSELKSNSKLVIGDLTTIAGEHKVHAHGIADAICARIFEAPAEQKLSSLYLLDSIVKNIGCEYVRYFASRLPEMFCETYRQVHPKFCPSMRHLFGTWSAIFPPSVLHKIETELEFSAPLSQQSPDVNAFRFSESPRPAHGIHVNPKYLEARRQFEHSMIDNIPETDPSDISAQKTTFGRKRKERDASTSPKRWSGASLTFHNAQSERENSSRLQLYGRKSTTAYDEYDADRSEFNTSRGSQKLGPAGNSNRVSSIGGAEKLVSPKSKLIRRPTSPTRFGPVRSLSPSHNEFTRENSPGGVPQFHSNYAYNPIKFNANDGKRDTFLIEYHPDDSHQLLGGSRTYNLNSGYNQQGPRALIDAYGNDRSNKTLNEKPLKVDINVNGVVNKAATGSWQNSEEDEYMWEDMSPTLTNQRGNDLMQSNLPHRSLSTRASLEMSSASRWKPDFGRGSWDPHAPLSVVDDSVTTSEERISILGPGVRYASSQGSQYATTHSQGSQQPWKTRQHLPQLSHHHNVETSGHVPLSMTRMTASTGPHISSITDKTLDAEAHFQRHSNVMSSMESSSSKLTPLPPASAVNYSRGRPQSPSKTKVPLTFPPANVNQSYPHSLLPNYSQQNQRKEHAALMDAHKPLSGQAQFPNHQAGLNTLNQQSERQPALSLPQGLQPRNAHETYIPSFPAEISSSLITQPPWNHGHNPYVHGATTRSVLSNQISGMPSSSANDPRRPDSSFHVHEGTSHLLSVGSLPISSQMGTPYHNIGPVASHLPVSNPFSGLIHTLVAQGLISAKSPATVQDSVGVEFNPDLLKVRYESAINALYSDLPRKCTTCGLRFKCQEMHSSHMDWHVTRNRVSKNCKQKPSRKWFVSTSVWLSGAEAVGSDAKPGFWSVKADLEEKVEKEIAVPADENQDACALCGEPFDDFYSDELEEWMYRGAVYLNAPNGSTNMDRSLLGPIVHAKCRSESEVNSLEDFGLEK